MRLSLVVGCTAVFAAQPLAYAGTMKCPGMSALLTGEKIVYNVRYRERLTIHKIGGGSSVDGLWKIDNFEQEIIYPNDLGMTLNRTDRHELGNGQSMTCTATVGGNRVSTACPNNSLELIVQDGRVRMNHTQSVHGQVQGKTMTWKFDLNNANEPTLKGTIGSGAAQSVRIEILPIKPSDRVKFNADSPGVAEVELEARVEPESYASRITWKVPELTGSTLKVSAVGGADQTKIKARYTGLPAANREFGERTVSAEIRDGACVATAQARLRFFYTQNAQNNAEGRYPNWFYYYLQTPAAQPEGRTVNIEYGGTTVGNCANSSNTAHYDIGQAYRTMRMCDLTRFGPSMKLSNKWVDRRGPVPKVGRGTTVYIDSFALTVLHEYQHIKYYEGWYLNKVPPPLDHDEAGCSGTLCDGIPDALEPALGFDPTRRKSYPALLDALDQEILARDVERDYRSGAYKKYDWAAPGSNWSP